MSHLMMAFFFAYMQAFVCIGSGELLAGCYISAEFRLTDSANLWDSLAAQTSSKSEDSRIDAQQTAGTSA